MALDFPASPNINDTYTFGGVTWTWDGTTWKVLGRFQFTSSETDPIFTASPASNIIQQNITNWNLAYGWGDHSTAGYLTSTGSLNSHTDVNIATLQDGQLLKFSASSNKWENWSPNYLTSYTETDPVFAASPAGGITGQNIVNWNEAYNWGNHNTSGYITSESDTLSSVVSRGNSTQDIISVGGVSLSGMNINVVQGGVDFFAGGNNTSVRTVLGVGGQISFIQNASAGSNEIAFFNAGGNVELYYAYNKKFETTATGVTITGDLNFTGNLLQNGSAFVTGGGGGANVTISDTAPGSAVAGDLWWESDKGRLKIYYNDTDSFQWVDASPPLAQPNVPVAAGFITLNGTSPTWTGTTGYTVSGAQPGGVGTDYEITLTFPTAYSARTDYIVQATYDGTNYISANGAQIAVARGTSSVVFTPRRWDENPLSLGEIMVTITNL